MEHRSASFMLRLQKGKVPQHQFVTESCGTRPETHAERERGEGEERRESACLQHGVPVHPCGQVCVYCICQQHPQQLLTTERRIYFSGVSGLNE